MLACRRETIRAMSLATGRTFQLVRHAWGERIIPDRVHPPAHQVTDVRREVNRARPHRPRRANRLILVRVLVRST